MDILATYKIGITVLIPVFSALTCGVLVLLSLSDCLTREEKNLKNILLFYLSFSGLGWWMTFCYEFFPVFFTGLNVVCLLSFVMPSIFFLPYSSLFDPTGATGTIFCSALFFTGSACGGITCMVIVRACGSADGNR